MKDRITPADISRGSAGLCRIEPGDLAPLPPPYEDFNEAVLKPLAAEKIKASKRRPTTRWLSALPSPQTSKKKRNWYADFLPA